MVETLVRGADHPISDALMMVFPMIANLTIVTDDSSIMQVSDAFNTLISHLIMSCHAILCLLNFNLLEWW